jgi:phosphatidate cytidylyltransferase
MKAMAKRIITGLALGALFWTSFIYLPPFIFSCILGAIFIQIILFEWIRLFDATSFSFWLVMPLYPMLPFALLIALNHMPPYRDLLLYLFVMVSALDTGSYIVGNLIGRHKIVPRISPGKTWEGFAGGYVASCIGMAVILYEQKTSMNWAFIAGFSLIICILALCGDLFESYLKRRAGVKDSGAILPGHGGFLDRFDGILFAVVIFFIFREPLARYLL